MAAKTKRAFREFVKLVEPIDDVRHVVAFADGAPEIFTYIRHRDDEVCRAIYQAEYRVADDFPELGMDFHIVYMEGRPLSKFVSPLPGLVFSRESDSVGNAE